MTSRRRDSASPTGGERRDCRDQRVPTPASRAREKKLYRSNNPVKPYEPYVLPVPPPHGGADSSRRELASLLARGYLRLLDKSRGSAVSRAKKTDVSLEVPALPRPHVDGHEAA